MKLRETFTTSNIVEDLRLSAGSTEKMNKSTYTKITVCAVAVGLPAGILSVFYPVEALLCMMVLFVSLLAIVPAYYIWKQHKKKSVSMDDYKIVEGVLSHKEEETHKETRGRPHKHFIQRTVTVTVYLLHFEDGRSLQLPGDNFVWSEEQSMSDAGLYNDVHRGDDFYLVVHKETGKIAAAYPKSRFVYQER